MRATVLLADSAQSDPTGKVHALGLGWSTTVSPTPAAAIVVFIKVPWSETNQRHQFTLELVDADGRGFAPPGPDGQPGAPVAIVDSFEVGRPAGLPPGTDIDHHFTVNLDRGLPLQPGASYEWRLTVDGEHHEDWSARFSVRPA